MKRKRKRLLVAFALAACLAAGMLLFLRSGYFAAQYKDIVLGRLESVVRGEVKASRIRGGVFSALIIENVEVKPDDFPGRIEVKEIGVSLNLWDMLVRRKRAAESISGIRFRQPHVYFFGGKEELYRQLALLPGLLGDYTETANETVTKEGDSGASYPRLQLTDGRLTLIDDNSTWFSLAGIYVLISPGEEQTKLGFKAGGGKQQKLRFQADGFTDRSGRADLRLKGKDISPRELLLFLPRQNVCRITGGTVDLQGRLVTGGKQGLRYQCDLDLKEMSATLSGTPVKLDELEGSVRLADGSAQRCTPEKVVPREPLQKKSKPSFPCTPTIP